MLMVQQYHSIHEIDPEFIPSLEVLLEEEVPHWSLLVKKHDLAPEKEMFTYFLFFGPTHNMPVGLAHVCLKFLDVDCRTLSQKFKFWNKDHKHWKQLDWDLKGTSIGMGIFNQKAGTSSNKKIHDTVAKYLAREDIVAFNFFNHKTPYEVSTIQDVRHYFQKDHYHLCPLTRSVNSYQEYLATLEKESKNEIKKQWMELHKIHGIELGEYPILSEAPKSLPFNSSQLEFWQEMGGQLLTFNKDGEVLGCILLFEGKNGNFFFEPFPFEAAHEAKVSDMLYIQYAILKFFEFSHSRKCHILKNLNKLIFDEKEDLAFFADQGFSYKQIVQSFHSKLEKLRAPL
ncbi:MAG TPA: hypothetical protein VKZ84_03355 [Bacteriovoracaceae bacterium]|nr:hypothetical protein [Bacteriovoracaceae bacterium]